MRHFNLSYQDAIKSRGIATTLNVTQHSDSRVLCQLINDNLLNHLGGNCIALAINCAFGDDDDVQTLAS